MTRLRPGLRIFLPLAALAATIVYWPFLSLQKLYVFVDIGRDTHNQFLPNLVHLAESLHAGRFPVWSTSHGIGQNIYPGVLSAFDPFNLLLVLLGPEHLIYGLGYIQALQTVCAGTLFFLLLRLLRIPPSVAMLFGLFAGFCNHLVAKGTWWHYASEGVVVLFALLAAERALAGRGRVLLAVALFFVASISFFQIWVHALLLVGYAGFRIADSTSSPAERRKMAVDFLQACALGAVLSLPVLVPWLLDLVKSPRAFGAESRVAGLFTVKHFWVGADEFVTAGLRALSSDVLGPGDDFRGSGNYLEAPGFYSGIATLLLLPQAFFVLEGRRRALAIAAFGLTILYTVFPLFRFFLNGFSGDYWKISSFWITPVWLLLAAAGLTKALERGRLSVRGVVAGGLFVALLLGIHRLIPSSIGPGNLDRSFYVAVAIFAGVYLAILAAGTRPRWIRFLPGALVLLAFTEVTLLNHMALRRRLNLPGDAVAGRQSYFDGTREAVARIAELEAGNPFYRVVKTYQSVSPSDNLMQGYRGLESYLSVNQPGYLRFLRFVGVPYPTSNWIEWPSNAWMRVPLLSLLGVKYALARDPARVPPGFERVEAVGPISIYRNPSVRPFAQPTDRVEPNEVLARLALPERDRALLDSVAVHRRSPLRALFPKEGRGPSPAGEARLTRFEEGTLELEASLERPSLVLLSMPFDEGWSAWVDGESTPVQEVDQGLSALVLPAGRHVVRMVYRPPGLVLSLAVSLILLAGVGGAALVRRYRRVALL